MPKKKPGKAERVELLRVNRVRLHNLLRDRPGVIVGLDLARGQTGLAINSLRRTETAIFSHKTKNKGFAKVIEIEVWLREHLDRKKIKLAMIEDYSYGSQLGREAAGEIGGVVRRYLWMRGIPTIPIAPGTIKSFIGAKDKSLIVKEVYKQFKVDANNDDEADAFVLAKLGETLYNALAEIRAAKKKDMKQCETHPHRFCSLDSKKAKTVKDIIVNKGEDAYAFAEAGEETRKKACAYSGKKRRKKKAG
jgi:hypothetical protein